MRKFSHALDNADHAQAPACMACQNDRARYRNCYPLNQSQGEARKQLRYALGEALSHPFLARAKPDTTTKENTYVQNQENWRDAQVLCNNNIVHFQSDCANCRRW
jgi:hypothetical protein